MIMFDKASISSETPIDPDFYLEPEPAEYNVFQQYPDYSPELVNSLTPGDIYILSWLVHGKFETIQEMLDLIDGQ